MGGPAQPGSPGRIAASFKALLPRRADYLLSSSAVRADLIAGVTVGITALPLALAFGITSGMGATAGLMTAIVAGALTAIFGGSQSQVSGPTGAMTVVLVPIVARHGREGVLLVGLIAGLLLIGAAIGRVGRYLAYVPWPVIEGFTLGIAGVIFLQQLPAAFGVPKPEGDDALVVAFRAGRQAIASGRIAPLAVVAIVVVVTVGSRRLHRNIPASLLGVAAGTAAVTIFGLEVTAIGTLPSTLSAPSFPPMSLAAIEELLPAAFAVALLAGLESLLSAKVADGLSDSARHDPDRELFGQGLSNVIVPLFGGVPSTGAIARTAVNVRAGARTRFAAIIHSVLLAAVVLAGSSVVARIPLAALAGILMVTSVRMVEVHNIRSVLRATRSDAAVLVLTATATVVFDLIVAVEIGMAVAAILALRHVARNSSITPEAIPNGGGEVLADVGAELLDDHILTYRLDGALFFGAAQRFLTELTAVKGVRVVILRLPELQVLDATGAQALGDIVEELEGRGVTVLLKGPRPEHLRILEAVGVLQRLGHESHLFSRLEDAVGHAREHVERREVV